MGLIKGIWNLCLMLLLSASIAWMVWFVLSIVLGAGLGLNPLFVDIPAWIVFIVLPIIWYRNKDKPLDPIYESYFRNRGRGSSSTDDWGEGDGGGE